MINSHLGCIHLGIQKTLFCSSWVVISVLFPFSKYVSICTTSTVVLSWMVDDYYYKSLQSNCFTRSSWQNWQTRSRTWIRMMIRILKFWLNLEYSYEGSSPTKLSWSFLRKERISSSACNIFLRFQSEWRWCKSQGRSRRCRTIYQMLLSEQCFHIRLL